MIGQPKFKEGDSVTFDFAENISYSGVVAIVDPFGTFSDPSDASYDIFVDDADGGILYKHISEKYVKPTV